MPCSSRYSSSASSTRSATHIERELPQRAEVALTEVVRERRVDLLGCVDVAVGHAAPQRLRGLVDELDLVGAPGPPRRGSSRAARCPVICLDHVVHRLEVLDVHRRDHVDARVEQLLDVLPALLVARARHVRVRELVDERDLRLPREDRVDVHLLERRVAVLDAAPRDRPRGRRSAPRCSSGRGSRRSRRRRRCHARDGADPRSASRRSCRRREPLRGRCGAVPRAIDSAYGHCAWSSATFSSSTLTPGSPRKPSERPSVCSSMSLFDLARAAARAPWRPGGPGSARSPPRCAGRDPTPTR